MFYRLVSQDIIGQDACEIIRSKSLDVKMAVSLSLQYVSLILLIKYIVVADQLDERV